MANSTNWYTQPGYKNLLVYKLAVVVFDLTSEFCESFITKTSRTFDQMIQAVRSGKQNIVEGSLEKSLKSYIKLLGVARASFEELLEDCRDFLRLKNLPLWQKDDPRLQKIRSLRIGEAGSPNTANLANLANLANWAGLPNSAEVYANLLITLISLETYLLDRLMKTLEEKFIREGGYTENLFKKRREFLGKLAVFAILGLLAELGVFALFARPVLAANSSIFSAEVWVKPETSVASKALVGKAEEIRTFTDASGYVGCQIKATTWQTAAQATTTALALNTWAHVTCTYDKITIRVFVNGVQVATQAETDTVDDTAVALKVGQDDSASTTYTNFSGTTDNFQFYNYARTAKQITEDMLASHPAVASAKGGAIAYYKFDEGADNTCSGGVNDACNSGSGGTSLDGAESGMSVPATATSGWTNSGKFGKALVFDGSNDYVNCGDNASIRAGQEFTISAWVKGNFTTTSNTIISRFSGASSNRSYIFRVYSSTKQFAMKVYSDNNNDHYLSTASNTALNTNQWYHVATVVNTALSNNNKIKLYLNGKYESNSVTDTSFSGTIGWTAGANTEIGSNSDLGSAYAMDGSIDDVKIYNYALTEDEVKTEYNRGSALVLGALGDNASAGSAQSSSQQYCVPGDSSACAAPVGEWKFDEGTGTTAKDTSGNNNTGTFGATTAAPSWTSGKIGKALKFDGVDDVVDVAHSSTINLSSAVSIEAWIYPTSSPLNYAGVFSKMSAYALLMATGNKVQFWGGGGTWSGLTSDGTINLNQWNHVVVTYDGTDKKIYINGRYDKSANLPGTIATNSGGAWIGYHNGVWFPGKIDHVRIFNYARSAAQISWDYNRGGPVGWWKFDECQGVVAYDSSGNSNNGTITIGATGTNTSAGTCTASDAASAWSSGATGKYNASLEFDGTDDYVTGTGVSYLNGKGTGSIFAWFKTSTAQNLKYLASLPYSSAGGSNGFDLYMTTSTVGGCVKANSAVCPAFTTTYNDSNWHQLGIVYDGTNVNLYYDGTVRTNSALTGNIQTAAGGEFNIGRFGSYAGTFFSGQIDDVRVFNYALTGTQVKTLFNENFSVRFGPNTGNP